MIVLTLVVVSLVLLSPLALELLDGLFGADWTRLSNIGETYGAISAVLTVFAVGRVALSLIFQSREVRASRAQTVRAFHHELLERAMDDPLYMRCWGGFAEASPAERKQNFYVNLMLSYWQMLYGIGETGERALRSHLAGDLFATEAGRRFWAAMRATRTDYEPDRDYTRFHRIVDDEYQKALAAGPPLVSAEQDHSEEPLPPASPLPDNAHLAGMALLGLAGGLLLRDPLKRTLRRQAHRSAWPF